MSKINIDFKTGSIKSKKEIIAGIDLGTTYSLIAYVVNGQAKIIPIGNSSSGMLPSVLYFGEEDKILVGDEARKMLKIEPERSLYSIKRIMGKTTSEIEKEKEAFTFPILESEASEIIKIKAGRRVYNPTELSSFILKEIKIQAEVLLNVEIQKVVITVPAYFTDSQRQATRDAGLLAGFDVLRIINEPTAASLAYGIGLKSDVIKQVMVYDFGGGTFDVSVLRIENGVFEILSTQGDNFLGGDDIDMAIVNHWRNKYSIKPDAKELSDLRILAESAKKALKNNAIFSTGFKNFILELDQEELNSIAAYFVDRTIRACQRAIKDSGLNILEIDEIILVGGSSRLALVKDTLISVFHRPINDFLNPDEVVALGAAIQADILAGNQTDILLLDITPLSLGIETLGGLMDTIVPRNSKIPLKLSRNYTTSKDGQKNLKIAVYQGERELVQDNTKLAEFILKDIPPMAAGLPKIEVNFSIDPNGILSVTAKELRSGINQSIEIHSAYKLSETELIQKLQDSVMHAESDIQKRAMIELENEANYIISNAQKFLIQNKEYLRPDELETLESSMNEISLNLKSISKTDLEKAIEQFNYNTTAIAQRIMNIQINKSLGGSSIDAI